ncbi:MAG: TrkH family potassium uptake protein [Clostridia bacterium]|nr:TrkH family potassium uptake protein [Clostridia bacterium]
MNKKLVFSTIGKLMLLVGVMMVPCLVVSLIYRDGQVLAFLESMGIILAVSLPIALFVKPENKQMYARDGMAIAGLSWICMSVMGALPLVLGGICGLADAFFEIASGFTTTGATIMDDVSVLPQSVNFLRCFTHWFGGMGVLVLTTALFPSGNGAGAALAKAESSGPSFSKLLPKLGDNSKLLYFIYSALTLLLVIALLICGLPLYDSIIHAFSTAGTGGFSNQARSIMDYNSTAIDIVISVFMMLFGVNFAIYFRLLAKEYKLALKNEEFWFYTGISAVAVLVIALNIAKTVGGFFPGLEHAFFQVGAVISTTGFSSRDFDTWPMLSKMILLLLMLFGSCAGSTAGGLKLIRVLLLGKLARREIGKAYAPRKVKVIKLDGKSVSEDMLGRIAVYFFIYIAIILFGMLVLAISGCTMTESLSGSISCMSNIGPAFERLGPMANYGWLPGWTKIVLSLIMIAGRLEIYPLLILFAPSAWRKN